MLRLSCLLSVAERNHLYFSLDYWRFRLYFLFERSYSYLVRFVSKISSVLVFYYQTFSYCLSTICRLLFWHEFSTLETIFYFIDRCTTSWKPYNSLRGIDAIHYTVKNKTTFFFLKEGNILCFSSILHIWTGRSLSLMDLLLQTNKLELEN